MKCQCPSFFSFLLETMQPLGATTTLKRKTIKVECKGRIGKDGGEGGEGCVILYPLMVGLQKNHWKIMKVMMAPPAAIKQGPTTTRGVL